MYSNKTNQKKHYKNEIYFFLIKDWIKKLYKNKFMEDESLPDNLKKAINNLRSQFILYFEQYDKPNNDNSVDKYDESEIDSHKYFKDDVV